MRTTHRYERGILEAVIDSENNYLCHLAGNRSFACTYLKKNENELTVDIKHEELDIMMFDDSENTISIINYNESECFKMTIIY